ncbi:MAG TPA: M20/M25/M40 family metallo-hydrolase [Candidatus Sulfopaludibacter sp.]|nr:M20/M25/M40 family metallo-hydrolase [Candidatus Sulfopaludibacter sp.]
MSRKSLSVLAVGVLLIPVILLSQQATERIDLNVMHKIKAAEFGGGGGGFGGGGGGGARGGSQVMNIMYNLTDRYGPRLTNSPQFRAAGEWAVGQLKEWGLSNVKLEKWATTGGRGGAMPSWEVKQYSGAMVEPTYMSIIGYPQAWSGGTNGAVTGEAILAQVQTADDMKKFDGKLKGKIVLISDPANMALPFPTTPLAHRYTDTELTDMIPDVIPAGGAGGRGGRGGRGGQAAALATMTPEERQAFQQKLASFYKDQGALLTISASARGEGGVVFASNGSPRTGDVAKNLASVAITAENYNRIARLLEHNVPVKLSFDIKVALDTTNTDSFNVIAEIPGTTKPNELVMVGGHFDSWHMGTGATDNAAGSAVAMEAMRILKSLNLKMDRTVRMGLWGGEEEGLLGSSAYVKEHFADPATMKPTAEHNGFAGYFNVDNGTGRIRGIYLQQNEMCRPIFEQWFAALKDITPGIITIRNTGGTDHQSYDRVGLPGFQFIQDPMDYDTRTHHSNMDVYDRIQQQDMEQMAVIEAAFLYNAATRPEKLPRNDMPTPAPAGGRAGRGGN